MILIGRGLDLAQDQKRLIGKAKLESRSAVQLSGCMKQNKFTISGGNDERVTPVPIPNTEVKPLSADGTWLDTARESRSSPDPISLEEFLRGVFFCVLGQEAPIFFTE